MTTKNKNVCNYNKPTFLNERIVVATLYDKTLSNRTIFDQLHNNNNCNDDRDYLIKQPEHSHYQSQEEIEQLLMNCRHHHDNQQEKWIPHHEQRRKNHNTPKKTTYVVQFCPWVEICPIASPLDLFDDNTNTNEMKDNPEYNTSGLLHDLWYGPYELDEMRYDARESVRYLRQNQFNHHLLQTDNNTSSPTTKILNLPEISNNQSNNRTDIMISQRNDSQLCNMTSSLRYSLMTATTSEYENETNEVLNSSSGSCCTVVKRNCNNSTATKNRSWDERPLLALSSETRGLEQRICTIRQKRKYLTIQLVVSVSNKRKRRKKLYSDDGGNDDYDDDDVDPLLSEAISTTPAPVPSSHKLAAFFTHCSMWATKLAVEEASRDYIRAYGSGIIDNL